MCRLMLCNNEYINNIGEGYMKTFLDHLEKECGGHSNGYAFIKDGVVIDIDKAVKLTNEEIIKRLYEQQPDWFMYHTRVASVGSIKDSNAHPYWNSDKSFVLCMNGTESEFGALADGLGITDTNLIFMNLNTFNINEEVLTGLSSKFLGFRNGKVFATNPYSTYGGLKFDDENGICIASSFPLGYKGDKSMDVSYIWREGEKIEEYIYTPKNYGRAYSDYSLYSDSWYDYYYNKQEETKESKSCDMCFDDNDELITVSENKLYDIIDECNDALEKREMSLDEVKEILIDKYGKDLKVKTPIGKRYIKFGSDFVFAVNNGGQYIY